MARQTTREGTHSKEGRARAQLSALHERRNPQCKPHADLLNRYELV